MNFSRSLILLRTGEVAHTFFNLSSRMLPIFMGMKTHGCISPLGSRPQYSLPAPQPPMNSPSLFVFPFIPIEILLVKCVVTVGPSANSIAILAYWGAVERTFNLHDLSINFEYRNPCNSSLCSGSRSCSIISFPLLTGMKLNAISLLALRSFSTNSVSLLISLKFLFVTVVATQVSSPTSTQFLMPSHVFFHAPFNPLNSSCSFSNPSREISTYSMPESFIFFAIFFVSNVPLVATER